MGLPIAAFNGLLKDNEGVQYQCPAIWKQSDRDYMASYLMSAEERRERELGFHLGPKYTLDEIIFNSHNPLILRYKWLIAIGVEVIDIIQASEPIVLTDPFTGAIIDPIVLVVPTSVTDINEILVTYPGSTTPIHPTKVVIAGGNVTIYIPRSRLVDPANDDNREDPLHYDDNSVFLTEVDIYRKWTDPSLGITYYRLKHDFTEHTHAGYSVVLNQKLSIISSYPATWASGVASPLHLGMCDGLPVRMTYLSGRRYSFTTELQTCRLAHTLMPHEPCTCNEGHMYWISDTDDSKTWTPYGRSVGALDAWMQDSRDRVGSGGMIK
jgi:hypothetical protein